MTEEEKKKIVKTMECVKCEHLFDCQGKPREVERCVRFEPRKESK